MELERDIRIPAAKRGEFQPLLCRMEIGESFAFPVRDRQRAMVAASNYKAKHPGWNYTVRSSDGQTRLWRIS